MQLQRRLAVPGLWVAEGASELKLNMRDKAHDTGRVNRGFLSHLLRDTSANTIAIMAMALIPIAGLAGSAVDTARLYVVRARLQQACDAGVLAGRKFMTEDGASTLNNEARTQAVAFFNNNFRSGWVDTRNVEFTPARSGNNRVTGTATAIVPMTIMKILSVNDSRLRVTCEARFDVPDLDIIFVLDTTGSMACLPSDSQTTCSNYVNTAAETSYLRPAGSATDITLGYANSTGWSVPEKSGSRISQLRNAVIDFYATLEAARQDSTRVRYGFVTYTSTVNAGAAIMAMRPEYMIGGNGAENWSYQSREITGEYQSAETIPSYNSLTQTNCTEGRISRSPSADNTFDPSTGAATRVWQRWYPSANPARCGRTTQTLMPVWTYRPRFIDVSTYVQSASALDPTKARATWTSWLGCIEERDTTQRLSSPNLNALPADLDPDLVPDGTQQTRWRPLWPDVTYWRKSNTGSNLSSWRTSTMSSNGDTNLAPNLSANAQLQGGFVSCGKPIQRLRQMNAGDISGYVNARDFAPIGGTYHDVGMIWGLRLLSRSGIFAPDHQPNGRDLPRRVIVFLTDGAMAPSPILYGLYGMELYDGRVANGDVANLTDYHNDRFTALCDLATDRMGVDVWTVALGTGRTTELTNCATTPDQALAPDPDDPAALSNDFRRIARTVAMLRLSK